MTARMIATITPAENPAEWNFSIASENMYCGELEIVSPRKLFIVSTLEEVVFIVLTRSVLPVEEAQFERSCQFAVENLLRS